MPNPTNPVTQEAFPTLDDYGAVVRDNSTDNKNTIAAYMLSNRESVYVPGDGHETVYTSASVTSLANRKFRGETKFRTPGDNLPANFRFQTVKPTRGTGTDVLYDFSGDLWFTDASYNWIAAGVREGWGERYFESTSTPVWRHFLNRSGQSGLIAKTNSIISPTGNDNQVFVDLSYGGTAGFALGDVVVFLRDIEDATYAHQAEITGISGSGATTTLTFSPKYTSGADIPNGSVVTKGSRTHATAMFINVIHDGKGDCGALTIRGSANTPIGSGEPHIFNNGTMGLIHGDVTAGAGGVYLNTLESKHVDKNFDVKAIGLILNFERQNDTGARGASWTGIFLQADPRSGYRPINNFFHGTGPADVGIDFGTNAVFTATKQSRAIALKEGMNISFDSTPETGGDYAGAFSVAGNTYMGLTSDGGTRRLRSVVGGVEALSVRTNGVDVAGGLSVGASKAFRLGGPGSNTYFIFDHVANVIALYKNGVQVATW